LIRALEQASGRSLREWARAWILRPGVPRMTVHVDDHSAATAVVHMRLDAGARANPVRMQMGATAHDGRLAHAHTVVLDRAQTKVSLPAPAAGRHSLVIDADDSAYAIIRGDARFIAATAASLTALRSPLHRMQAWERLWQAVRDRDLDPASYAWYAIAHLDAERQPMIVAAVVQRLESSERLLAAERADALARALDEFVLAQASMSDPELRNVWLNALASCARTPQGWARLERIASGKLAAARTGGPALRRRSALMLVLRGAWSERQALRALAGEREHPPQFRLQLEAARPDAAGKARLLERFLGPGVLADEAICATLGLFNHPAHAALTLPLLGVALRALPALYRSRKIFFVNRWIGAFVGGQCSQRALACVRSVLARKRIDPAIASKLAEADFELALALAIRHRWTDDEPRTAGSLSAAAGSSRSARTARRPGG
jgi:aminopeptidase N